MINMILARDKNGAIGYKGSIPWSLPEDMAFFRRVTWEGVIIMGRKTFESIGKPLPHRINVVITRQKDYEAKGCLVFNDLEEAIEKTKNLGETFVIGGAELYKKALPLAKVIYVTEIQAEFKADTFFPAVFDPLEYNKLILRHISSANGYPAYEFVRYTAIN